MKKKIISVIGGTGLQGGGVVNALLARGEFDVRVVTRDAARQAARALAERGVEVVQADLLDPGALPHAFEGAYGAFVVTNFWDPGQGAHDALPNGSVLAVCGGVYSWDDLVGTLKALGHDVQFVRVPADAFDRAFPGAHEVREMFDYFEGYTYFGPDRDAHIAAANALVP